MGEIIELFPNDRTVELEKGWVVYDLRTVFHVCPTHDLKPHVACVERECWCEPSVHYEGDIPIYTHNAADGRERYETTQ